jgi:hypothetical protein
MAALATLLQTLLTAVLPLLERRTVAAERSAAAAEDQAASWRFLLQIDAEYQAYLATKDPLRAAESAAPGEVEAQSEAERDENAARLEQFREYWYLTHGELLDDERLVAEWERAYAGAQERVEGRFQ